MFTLNEVPKYNAIRESSTEGESLIERIRVTREEVTKFLKRAQTYQACTYKISYRDIEYECKAAIDTGITC